MKNFFKKIFSYFQDLRKEVKKVDWLKRKELWVTTITVLVIISVSAIFLLIIDSLLYWLIQILFNV